MRKVRERRRYIQKLKQIYYLTVAVFFLLEIGYLFNSYHAHQGAIESDARYFGAKVASSIKVEVEHSITTAALLEDLYILYGDYFLEDFNKICAELSTDNLAIGNMYFAPAGVLRYGYPYIDSVVAMNHDILLDPTLGPKARKAIEDRRSTIAGPYNLLTGGKGFVLRKPVFEQNKFKALVIVVLEYHNFFRQVSGRLQDDVGNYNIAVWKDEDKTCLVDEAGYIYTFGVPIQERRAVVDFATGNDEWHVAVEPVNGWAPWHAMMLDIYFSMTILVVLLVISTYIVRSMIFQAKQRLVLENEKHANKAKTIFLNSMSHDMRTPMNAIIGFSTLAKKHVEKPDMVKDYLEKILTSGHHLLDLINDVLDMSRIESGAVHLDPKPLQLGGLLQELQIMVSSDVQRKQLEFQLHIEKLEHANVIADKLCLSKVLLNLISNAVKYTPRGGRIDVYVEEDEQAGFSGYLFRIKDTGIGMSATFQTELFQPFSREKTTTVSGIQGTGLGMAITKHIIDIMGGSITVTSQQGAGSEFSVLLTLPWCDEAPVEEAVVEQYVSSEELKQQLSGCKVLLVEDNLLNQEIASEVLKSMGIIVTVADDGDIALQLMKQAKQGDIDLILMDVQMPRMDGYEATQHIRRLPDRILAQIPIIAMTANAFAEDRQAALMSGMNDHLAKPFDVNELGRLLCQYLGKREV